MLEIGIWLQCHELILIHNFGFSGNSRVEFFSLLLLLLALGSGLQFRVVLSAVQCFISLLPAILGWSSFFFLVQLNSSFNLLSNFILVLIHCFYVIDFACRHW